MSSVKFLSIPISCVFVLLGAACPGTAQDPSVDSRHLEMPEYSVLLERGDPPRLQIERDGKPVIVVPVVSAVDSETQRELLSGIHAELQHEQDGSWRVIATAKSNLWTGRRFVWKLLPDRLEFQQFAAGHGKLGRIYFLSSGVSNRWDKGSTPGHLWATTIYADRYFSPSPNHANQFEFDIAMPQTLGFSTGRYPDSEEDFRPERMTGLFAPPPLFLAFDREGFWAGIGIGAKPGEYQFPAFEYSGSRYAGASFYIDYMGYRTIDGEFASPVLAVHFGKDPIQVLTSYNNWLDQSGFSTHNTGRDVLWHHLPIFCGWAEQTVESVPFGAAANALSTQANYESWLVTLEKRGLPVGTVVIDDKWQSSYGTFEVDLKKWPDMKAFVSAQHARGRHVLLWVPFAHPEGLPDDLCIKMHGKCLGADVGNPDYETYLRGRIRHLVDEIGIDGFKEDWMGGPTVPGLPLSGSAVGIEFVRRFQWILWSEAHKWKPDAMVETQTPNALFRESSDLIRLNDIWYATRNLPRVLRTRAAIAHAAGWPLVDTDNASSTTLEDWWSYMKVQPTIGVPALYFVTKTEATQESPTGEQWTELKSIWDAYIQSVNRSF
jgi:hypothetical protein